MKPLLWILLLLAFGLARAEQLYNSRIGSLYVSESFINEQLAGHVSGSDMVKNLKLKLDPATSKMYLRGDFTLPLDDLRGAGVDRHLGDFKFQLSILPRINADKHLVLEFPISETYFYQANSRHPQRDRVVIPVQLLSLGLAATRGYLAALSGDFSAFERKVAKNRALLAGVSKLLQTEKNPDAAEALRNEKKSLELTIASIDLERARFARPAKTLNSIFAFSGEKELNLNEEIKANKNIVILKLGLSKLVPYLRDIELGGIRAGNSTPAAGGENYLIFDINTLLTERGTEAPPSPNRTEAAGVPPALMVRLGQALFVSKLVVDQEREKLGPSIKDFDILFQEDGIHIKGSLRKFFVNVPFDGLVDFVYTGPDVFEVRLRELEVLRLDFSFLTPLALRAIAGRLKKALNGIAVYKYVGKKDHSRVLRVRVDPKKLIPAFPDFHLVGVDVRDRNFMLKIGRIQQGSP